MFSKKNVIKKLMISHIKIASVESFTGGLFSSTIINYPNVSSFFIGSLVTYNNSVKEKLGIDTSNGVVNKEVAKQMALKGKEYFNVDYCISFTGNAGPKVLDSKKVGQVYISINENTYELLIKSKSRNRIRKKATKFALQKLYKLI